MGNTRCRTAGLALTIAVLAATVLLPHVTWSQPAPKADFVFIIDATPSMGGEIASVKAGLSGFVTGLMSENIDARFAIVLFGGEPELVLDFTDSYTDTDAAFAMINVNGAVPGFQNAHNVNPEAGLEAIRTTLGGGNEVLAHNNVGGDGVLDFRPDARIDLIAVTDENSDRPFHPSNRLPGQTTNEPPFPLPPDWQTEIDVTAGVVVQSAAFINLLVNPGDVPTQYQYGDPASDVSDPDLLNFDPAATLQNLIDGGFGNSLEAQVLSAGLIGRSFNILQVNDPDFIANFFAAKVEEVLAAVVALDIKPGSCPNPLNTRSNGVLPVAVLGTADLDVAEIDVATVLLEGVPPIRSYIEDVGTPFDGELCDCHAMGADGFPDLTLKFKTQDIVAALGPVIDREERILTLTANLLDGSPIEGQDCILVIAPSAPPPVPAIEQLPGEIHLSWAPSGGPSFLRYAVYCGDTPDFLPDTDGDYLVMTGEPHAVDASVNPGETRYYRIGVYDEPVDVQTTTGVVTMTVFSGYSESAGVTAITGVGERLEPTVLSLKPASPNPFRSSTTISFTLPTPERVQISVYDISGRLVDRLVDGHRPAGAHIVQMNGAALPSGMYFIRLETGDEILTSRVTLMR